MEDASRPPQQTKRPRGRPKGIHTSIKLNPEVTKFLAEKIPANAIAQLQGVQTRTVKEFFKANDINPTLEKLSTIHFVCFFLEVLS